MDWRWNRYVVDLEMLLYRSLGTATLLIVALPQAMSTSHIYMRHATCHVHEPI